MPEGDAVLRTARRLDAALRGREITRSDLRFPSVAAVDLSGRTTLEVIARGKHLLHRLSGDVTLHSHLKMEGSWRIFESAPPTRDHRIRAVLHTEGPVAVGRQLGNLDVVRTEREDALVGHLGPDLLGADWDAERAAANLSADGRALGEALLDQQVLAGLGTMWVSEALFAARLNPGSQRRDPDELATLIQHAHRLIHDAVDKPRGRGRGESAMLAYGRVGLPCQRCRTPIRAVAVGPPGRQRTLNYCPTCQEGLAPGDDGSRTASSRVRRPSRTVR
ncbi:MAG: DNA-formamidopyrimidine glycosylase family protein [Nocardioides sp.]|jgi:endonuclease-8